MFLPAQVSVVSELLSGHFALQSRAALALLLKKKVVHLHEYRCGIDRHLKRTELKAFLSYQMPDRSRINDYQHGRQYYRFELAIGLPPLRRSAAALRHTSPVHANISR